MSEVARSVRAVWRRSAFWKAYPLDIDFDYEMTTPFPQFERLEAPNSDPASRGLYELPAGRLSRSSRGATLTLRCANRWACRGRSSSAIRGVHVALAGSHAVDECGTAC